MQHSFYLWIQQMEIYVATYYYVCVSDLCAMDGGLTLAAKIWTPGQQYLELFFAATSPLGSSRFVVVMFQQLSNNSYSSAGVQQLG
jgi:hypothetical protein